MKKLLFILLNLTLVFTSCKKEIDGCMDSSSSNYNPKATNDDGSCILIKPDPIVIDSTPNVIVDTTHTTNNGSGTCSNHDLSKLLNGDKFTYYEKSNYNPLGTYYVQFKADGTFYIKDYWAVTNFNGAPADAKPYEGTWVYGDSCKINCIIMGYLNPVSTEKTVLYNYTMVIIDDNTFELSWFDWIGQYQFKQSFVYHRM